MADEEGTWTHYENDVVVLVKGRCRMPQPRLDRVLRILNFLQQPEGPEEAVGA